MQTTVELLVAKLLSHVIHVATVVAEESQFLWISASSFQDCWGAAVAVLPSIIVVVDAIADAVAIAEASSTIADAVMDTILVADAAADC